MRGVQLGSYGDPERVLACVEMPGPAAGQALVQVAFAPVNPNDLMVPRVAKNEERLKRAHLRRLDGDSDDVLEALVRDLRAEIQADRAKLGLLKSFAEARPGGPTPAEVDELTQFFCGLWFLNELDEEFDDDLPTDVRVGQVREALRKLFKGGAITLEPQAEKRVYVATGVLWPLALLDKTRTPGATGRAFDNASCAGAI